MLISNNEIAVYSAIFGGKDSVHEIDIQINADAFLFTDDRNLKSKSFKVIHVKPRFVDDPLRSSRYYKILPHRHLKNYRYSLWIDGNRKLAIDPNVLIKSGPQSPIIVYPHQRTDKKDPYHEASHCIDIRKDTPDIIKSQIRYYKDDGLPKKFGLWSCAVILRDHNNVKCAEFCEMWWEEILLRSKRDQISFPYIVWKTGLWPANFEDGIKITEKHKHLK